MSATAQISLQDYLDTNFEDRPPEYIDGELVERPMTSMPNGKAQSRFDRHLGGVCEAHGRTVVVEAPCALAESASASLMWRYSNKNPWLRWPNIRPC